MTIGSNSMKRMTTLATLATAAALTLPQTATAADSEDVEVVNTETVQVYTDATGAVESSRVYEQLALTGTGEVELTNPIETDGLRNLDEFGGVDVEDGQQVVNLNVDGEEHLRSVSDYDGDLPLEVEVQYFLDGEEVEPSDIVGESGALQVIYKVRNVTAQPQEVTYADGSGGTVTETVDVPVPMVGSLTTTAPASFTDVDSEQANMAGDGKGGTKLSFTMTLFPPIGSESAEFGYTATITDGVVPRADISALPVNPLDSPTFKSAAESYQGGSDTGGELAAGATEIDTNLLKLRDGAGDLLAGLIKLQSGSAELASGLSGEAAPGAARLADGAGELREGTEKLEAGTDQLDTGAGRLSDGADQLSDGAGDAHTGSQDLTDGLQQISGGLDQLAGKLPGAQDGIKQLQDGVDLILAGIGDPATDGTLINGLTRIESGALRLRGGLQQLRGTGSAPTPGLLAARGGVDMVKNGLDGALAPANGPGTPGGDLAELRLGLQAIDANFCATHPTPGPCSGLVNQLLDGVAGSRTSLGAASAGLGDVSAGLTTAIASLGDLLIPGAGDLADGATDAKNGAIELRSGVRRVDAGLTQLSDGITDAVSGVLRLSDGAGDAVDGSSELSDGLGRLDDGAGDLAAGAGELAAGTGELSSGAGDLNDGAGQIADGAGELADGLGEAADGSERLADGLGQAADGAPELVDGAQRLSDEGTKQLAKAGTDTAQNYGQLYATIAAGAERADAEKMAYGAPEGAAGLTAYSFVVQGEDGEGGKNLTRGLLGGLLLAFGVGVVGLRRRLV